MHINELHRCLTERYPLRQEIINWERELITVVIDPDQFLDELSKEETTARYVSPIGYLWPFRLRSRVI